MKNSVSPNSLSTSYAKNKIPCLKFHCLIDFPGFTMGFPTLSTTFLCQPQPQAHGRILDEEEEDDDAGQAPPVPRPGYIANRSDESWMVG